MKVINRNSVNFIMQPVFSNKFRLVINVISVKDSLKMFDLLLKLFQNNTLFIFQTKKMNANSSAKKIFR